MFKFGKGFQIGRVSCSHFPLGLQSYHIKSHHNAHRKASRFKYLLLFGIPVGFSCLALHNHKPLRSVTNRDEPSELNNLMIACYRMLPLRFMSQLWGRINSVDIPEQWRPTVFEFYAKMFHCKIEEAAVEELTSYKNLGQFFRRALKPSVRPIANSILVAPCDGMIISCGRVGAKGIEQVKGIHYSTAKFLSGDLPLPSSVSQKILYQCTIYLAPGDYHRFHSPTTWQIHKRMHIPGDLLSVNPKVFEWIRGLLVLNERVVYSGIWRHGFFSMTPVGATNVGSIVVYHDKELLSNQLGASSSVKIYANQLASGIPFTNGESFGEFNLGSTIVLVFEAPDNFVFHVNRGQLLKMGQALGRLA